MISREIRERFRSETESCNLRLNSELQDAWKGLHALLAGQFDAFCRIGPLEATSPSLGYLSEIFTTKTT
jgi:hypothetical protein